MNKAKETLRELLLSIVFWFLVIFMVGGLISRKTSFLLGLLLGTVIAVIMVQHMYYSLDRALDMDERSATKYTRKQAGLRMVLMCLCLGVAFTFPQVFHVVGTMLGIFTLKFGALSYPLIHKLLSRFSVNKGR